MTTHNDTDLMFYYHQDCMWYRCETNSCKCHPTKEISGDWCVNVAGNECDDFVLADDRLEALNKMIAALKGVLADVERDLRP